MRDSIDSGSFNDPKRNRCFSETFVTHVPKSNLYGYVRPAKISDLVDEGYYNRWCCHITIWVYVIAVVEILAVVISMVATIVELAKHADYMTYPFGDFIIALVATCISVLVIGLLILGVIKKKYSFLIPHMICQILSIIGFAIAIIIYGVKAGTDHAHWDSESEHGKADDAKNAEAHYDYEVAVIILCVIGLVVESGFYAQVSKCYRYLQSKRIRRMHLVRRRSSI